MGIGYVRFDKRGVGQSTGSYMDVGASNSEEAFEILAGDVAAVVDHIASLEAVDSDRVGLIGASQAGWIMPLAALEARQVGFVVSISGAASTVGVSDYFDSIAEHIDNPGEIATALSSFRGEHGFDPAPVLEQLDIPMLWLYGGRDTSNPTANDIRIIEGIRDEMRKDFTIELFANGDHHLVDADTGEPYDTFLAIAEWLRTQGILDGLSYPRRNLRTAITRRLSSVETGRSSFVRM